MVSQHTKGGSFRVCFDAFISVTFVAFRVLFRWLRSLGGKKKTSAQNTENEGGSAQSGGTKDGPQPLSVEECAARRTFLDAEGLRTIFCPSTLSASALIFSILSACLFLAAQAAQPPKKHPECDEGNADERIKTDPKATALGMLTHH